MRISDWSSDVCSSDLGRGLQDHYAVRVVHRVTRPITLNERARGPRLLWEIGKWLATGTGLLAFSPAHVGAFLRSTDDLDDPDLQFVFTPASYSDGVVGQLQRVPGMTLGVWQMRPHSTGHVRALSANVTDAPEIRSEEHTSELQSLMRSSYAVFCLKKKNTNKKN